MDIDESCHIWMSHGAHLNESCPFGITHAQPCHLPLPRTSVYGYERVMSRLDKSWHAYE